MIRSAVRAGSPAAARDRGRCPVPEDEVGMGIEQQRWLDSELERSGTEIDILRRGR
jgi:hypothetical protein